MVGEQFILNHENMAFIKPRVQFQARDKNGCEIHAYNATTGEQRQEDQNFKIILSRTVILKASLEHMKSVSKKGGSQTEELTRKMG